MPGDMTVKKVRRAIAVLSARQPIRPRRRRILRYRRCTPRKRVCKAPRHVGDGAPEAGLPEHSRSLAGIRPCSAPGQNPALQLDALSAAGRERTGPTSPPGGHRAACHPGQAKATRRPSRSRPDAVVVSQPQQDHGPRLGQDLGLAARCREIDGHATPSNFSATTAVIVTMAPRSSSGTTTGFAEPDLVGLDGARIADPLGDHPTRGRHGQHSVGDDVGKPDRGGDPFVPVDRVEVAAGPGVHDQVHPLERGVQPGQFVTDGDVVVSDRTSCVLLGGGGPARDDDLAGGHDQLAGGGAHLAAGGRELVTSGRPDVVDRGVDRQLVAGADRTFVGEVLLAMNDPTVVEARSGSNMAIAIAFIVSVKGKVGGAMRSS